MGRSKNTPLRRKNANTCNMLIDHGCARRLPRYVIAAGAAAGVVFVVV